MFIINYLLYNKSGRGTSMKASKKFYLFWKRLLDIIFSFLAIIIWFIPMVIIGLIVAIDSRGPVFFRQERVGKNQKIFKIWKFRSMKINTPKYASTGELENPEQHITRWGKFIRKTSLDEVPQIFNIFVGQMSFIGPRPTIPNEVELRNLRAKYNVYDVRPGISGLSQVSGRDILNSELKAKLDGQYVKKISLWLDIKIFVKTIFYVLGRKGVKEGKHNTSREEIILNKEIENNLDNDKIAI